MTARPVAPVIPGASPGRRQGNSGARRPVPLASPPDRPDVVYGFGRIDASGRVADRVTIAALGWRGGDRLTVTGGRGDDRAPRPGRHGHRAGPAVDRDPRRAAPPLRAARRRP